MLSFFSFSNQFFSFFYSRRWSLVTSSLFNIPQFYKFRRGHLTHILKTAVHHRRSSSSSSLDSLPTQNHLFSTLFQIFLYFFQPQTSPPTHSKPFRFSSTPSSKFAFYATISVGDKLPESTFSYLDAYGQVQTITLSDLTKGKKAILFVVPGAFTPTCSQKHVPGFVVKSAEPKAKGVYTIACISVNDAFVMKAWKENLKVNDEVLLLSDGNGDFTRAIGVELDLSDKPVGLGVRSRRYALLAEDGVVKVHLLPVERRTCSKCSEDVVNFIFATLCCVVFVLEYEKFSDPC